MRLTPQQKANLTPLAHWLLRYAREREITLTDLSRQAGLSLGTLRSLILYPQRISKLETCLQLAKVTGEPPDKIFALAGLKAPVDLTGLDPDRIALLRAYDNLPSLQLKKALARFSQALAQSQLESGNL